MCVCACVSGCILCLPSFALSLLRDIYVLYVYRYFITCSILSGLMRFSSCINMIVTDILTWTSEEVI